MRLLLASLILLISFNCKGQENAFLYGNKKYVHEALIADFTYFRQILLTKHPSIYRYNAKDSILYYFSETKKNIGPEMTELDFWELLQNLVSKLGSGHTVLSLSSETSNMYDLHRHFILPFHVCIKNDNIYIRDYLTLDTVKGTIGRRLLAINDIEAPVLLTRFRKLYPGENKSTCYKDFKLEHGEFNFIFNLLYGEQRRFQIKLENIPETINVLPAIMRHKFPGGDNKQEADAHYPDTIRSTLQKPVHYLMFPNSLPSTAILTIKSFDYRDYDCFHYMVFTELKKKGTLNLVIDLRNNTGGYDNVCFDLLKYLIGKPYYLYKSTESNRLANHEASLRAVNVQAIDSVNVNTIAERHSSEHSWFKGKIIIITNKGTFSDASLFATAVKYQRDCLVIGQETGGAECGSDGGRFESFELPHTRLVLRVPLSWVNSLSTKNAGSGLLPDILTEESCRPDSSANSLDDPIFVTLKQIIKH